MRAYSVRVDGLQGGYSERYARRGAALAAGQGIANMGETARVYDSEGRVVAVYYPPPTQATIDAWVMSGHRVGLS